MSSIGVYRSLAALNDELIGGTTAPIGLES
jgi:hypothetical protein